MAATQSVTLVVSYSYEPRIRIRIAEYASLCKHVVNYLQLRTSSVEAGLEIGFEAGERSGSPSMLSLRRRGQSPPCRLASSRSTVQPRTSVFEYSHGSRVRQEQRGCRESQFPRLCNSDNRAIQADFRANPLLFGK